ncbi:MAG: hypothetical protein QME68_00750 [Elusimicrobiota bacterium]|nr:hypothetical protein [Elusimicrobiota bacterium]
MADNKQEQKKDKSLQELILDTNFSKYRLVPLATRWIEELKQKDEYKYFSTPELIETALKDILTGKVSIEEIEKLPPRETKKKVEKYEQKIAKEKVK